MIRRLVLLFAALCALAGYATSAHAKFVSSQVALVVNDSNADSVAIAAYYKTRRGISDDHVIHVNLASTRLISLDAFNALKTQVDARLATMGSDIQVVVLAWTLPFRVNCNSITWALVRGYAPVNVCSSLYPSDPNYNQNLLISPYYNSSSDTPYNSYGMRLATMLAGRSVADVKMMIDRSVEVDGTNPVGKAYTMYTTDTARRIRAVNYELTGQPLGTAIDSHISVSVPHANTLSNKTDTLVFMTGTNGVDFMAATLNNVYPKGAAIDDLTSFGCYLDNGFNCLDFIKGPTGATATYGTVSEPYAILSKFPDLQIFVRKYTSGKSIMQAYWASVQVPWQGLFIGDPLSAAYGSAPDNPPPPGPDPVPVPDNPCLATGKLVMTRTISIAPLGLFNWQVRQGTVVLKKGWGKAPSSLPLGTFTFTLKMTIRPSAKGMVTLTTVPGTTSDVCYWQ